MGCLRGRIHRRRSRHGLVQAQCYSDLFTPENAQATPWGDALREQRNNEGKVDWKEVTRAVGQNPHKPLSRWPLTHGERIEELEEMLRSNRNEGQKEDIRAAIRYHEGFHPERLCTLEEVGYEEGR